MPYWKAFYHLTWTTQSRLPLITPTLEPQLYAVIRTVADRLGAPVHAVNGTEDHVHVVVSVPPAIALARLISQLKGGTAHLANHLPAHRSTSEQHFAWSRGYGLFTLGPSQLARAVSYVRHQKEHHRLQRVIADLERTGED